MKKGISGEATGVWPSADDDRVAGELKIEDPILPIPFAYTGRHATQRSQRDWRRMARALTAGSEDGN